MLQPDLHAIPVPVVLLDQLAVRELLSQSQSVMQKRGRMRVVGHILGNPPLANPQQLLDVTISRQRARWGPQPRVGRVPLPRQLDVQLHRLSQCSQPAARSVRASELVAQTTKVMQAKTRATNPPSIQYTYIPFDGASAKDSSFVRPVSGST
jgi:hypothetical protein